MKGLTYEMTLQCENEESQVNYLKRGIVQQLHQLVDILAERPDFWLYYRIGQNRIAVSCRINIPHMEEGPDEIS